MLLAVVAILEVLLQLVVQLLLLLHDLLVRFVAFTLAVVSVRLVGRTCVALDNLWLVVAERLLLILAVLLLCVLAGELGLQLRLVLDIQLLLIVEDFSDVVAGVVWVVVTEAGVGAFTVVTRLVLCVSGLAVKLFRLLRSLRVRLDRLLQCVLV